MTDRARLLVERLIRIASSPPMALVLYLSLPGPSLKKIGLLFVGSAATYLHRRDGRILQWSAANSAIGRHLGGAGWERENRRLAVSCAAMVVIGGILSLVMRAWIERMSVAMTEMAGLSGAYTLAQPLHILGNAIGIVFRASRVFVLVVPGFVVFAVAHAVGRKAVVEALPVERRTVHLSFERCLLSLYLGVAVVIASLTWLILVYDVIVASVWWMSGRLRTRTPGAEDTLVERAMEARGSIEGTVLLSFASTLVVVPALLALMAERYGRAQYAFAACYLLLPAVPFVLAGCSRRFQRGTVFLLAAFAGTAVLAGVGLYAGLRFPACSPAGSLVVDVARDCLQTQSAATRAAALARMNVICDLIKSATIFVAVMLYPVAALQASAEGWLCRSRLSQWHGYMLLSYAAFVGGMAFLGQFVASRLIHWVMYRAPELSRMAVVRTMLPFHILMASVFLIMAAVGWSALKAIARVGLFGLSSDGAWTRDVTLEAQWQRSARCLAVGSIALSGLYGLTLLSGTNAQIGAMHGQVVREQAEVRQAVDARDWRRVASMASTSPTGEARMDALLAIGSHRRVDLLHVVISALRDPNPDVSATAISTCAYLGDSRALPAVQAWRTSVRPVYRPFVDLAVVKDVEVAAV